MGASTAASSGLGSLPTPSVPPPSTNQSRPPDGGVGLGVCCPNPKEGGAAAPPPALAQVKPKEEASPLPLPSFTGVPPPPASSAAGNKRRKAHISEADVALMLGRYNANTVLSLLQEIANCATSVKLNWSAMVKKSNTGIKNAREFQALWRHLAYRENIAETFEDDMQPLEDDSDVEFEIEPLPAVSPDVAKDVVACVKILATSGAGANITMSKLSTSEAPFKIDIPNAFSGWDAQGNGSNTGGVHYVYPSPGTASASLHHCESQPARKKRKLWTPEEDQELIAAVERCGEGNWATILKCGFKHDRTAAQLSQRWALIRKRRDIQVVSNPNISVGAHAHASGNQGPTYPTHVLASNNPPLDRLHATSATVAMPTSNNAPPSRGAPSAGLQEQNMFQNIHGANVVAMPISGKAKLPTKKAGSAMVPAGSTGRHNVSTSLLPSVPNINGAEKQLPVGGKLPVVMPSLGGVSVFNTSGGRNNVAPGIRGQMAGSIAHTGLKGPDPMVQAAAVAAGARIAPPSAAASLLKAAQSRNALHIGPGGVVAKGGHPSQSGASSMATGSMRVSGANMAGPRNSNGAVVHYIRTGTTSSSSNPSFLAGSTRPPPPSQQPRMPTKVAASTTISATLNPLPPHLARPNASSPTSLTPRAPPTSSPALPATTSLPSSQTNVAVEAGGGARNRPTEDNSQPTNTTSDVKAYNSAEIATLPQCQPNSALESTSSTENKGGAKLVASSASDTGQLKHPESGNAPTAQSTEKCVAVSAHDTRIVDEVPKSSN